MSRIWARRSWRATPAALERVTPADVTGLKEGMQRYGLLLTDAGTIRDDFMFSRLAGEKDLYLVVNAGTKEGDFAYIAEELKGAATLMPRPDRALLALQGPAAARALEKLSPGISELTFMQVRRATVAGAPAIVGRTGYTGEDGFEISLEGADAEKVSRARCWPIPTCCRSVWARAIPYGWKPACASMAMTSTRPAIRPKPR